VQIWQLARERGKRAEGIETAAEQLGAFERLGARLQLAALRETVRHLDKLPAMIEQTIALYRREELAEVMRVLTRPVAGVTPTPETAEYIEAMQRVLFEERNAVMVERALPHLESGGAFVAVGAGHLPGERGMLHLLARRGFTLVRTSAD
jgi:uncharacterized protein